MSQVKDNEKVYDEQIAPLVDQIIAICNENDLPFVADFEYAPDHFCTSLHVPVESAPRMQTMGRFLSVRVNGRGILGFGGLRAPRGGSDANRRGEAN